MKKEFYESLLHEKEFRMSTQKRKFTDAFTCEIFKPEEAVIKGKFLYENDETKGILKRTIVANTYNYMDSHDDVHLAGIFSKSIQERGNRIPHLHDHKFELGAKVGRALSFTEAHMKWRALGHAKNGDTIALLMESQIEQKLNAGIYEEYKADAIDQHSVGMLYIKVDVAINDENYKQEYATWEEVYPLLGNKDRADAKGYFFAVREAKLIEVSAVLLGSNELTPTLNNKIQPDLSTGKDKEPIKTTLNVSKLISIYSQNLKN